MNQEPIPEPLDRRDDAWLEGVLSFDAKSPHHGDDRQFVSSLMAELPAPRSFYTPQLARLFLAGSACSAAALVVIDQGQALIGAFGQAAIEMHPAQMITSIAPFAVLLGLGIMTFKMQRDQNQ